MIFCQISADFGDNTDCIFSNYSYDGSVHCADFKCLRNHKTKEWLEPLFYYLTICPQMILSISCGRDDGELPIRDVRLESTCARGNHACCDACALKVGMFFSYLDIFIFSYIIWECKGSLFQFICKIFLNILYENDLFLFKERVICPF